MKKIFSISLAFILLTSNLGLALGTHFCCGEAVESRLIIIHSDMPDMDNNCPGESKHIEAKTCCENKYQQIEIADDYRANFVQVISLNLVTAFVQVFLNLNIIQSDHNFLNYLKISPPQPGQDIIILVQSFLL